MQTTPDKIPIAVSSCLLGQEVRYDGGHKHNGYLTQTLGRYFEYIPFCPEVAIGLGIPRPPIRLVHVGGQIRAQGVKDPQLDVTAQLQDYAHEVVPQLAGVCGYILKRASPSCGMERVKVYSNNNIYGSDSGIYAAALMQAMPELPIEEEGRLMDPVLRENFIERVFVYASWQALRREGLTADTLVRFHTGHKFSLLAHNETSYRELGRLVADAGKADIDVLAGKYFTLLMQTLKEPATRKKHTNVLMHIMGYVKDALDSDDKQELLDVLERYRIGQVPLIVPLTLLKHHLRKHPDTYIAQQVYLNPHPEELMLRNSL